MSESRWKVVHRLIEEMTKRKVSNRREVVHGFVKLLPKTEMKERRREIGNCMVETSAKTQVGDC
jgi:hypothetical protein